MKPVNLLPAGERRHVVRAKRLENSSFVVLGLLGALLLASLYYVSTQNEVNTGKTDIAKAKRATAEANARASRLGPFAKFAAIKETRVSSVEQLATQRFDWERMMRELALVLPSGTAINKLDASTGPGAASASGGSSSSSAPAPSAEDPQMASAGSSLSLVGCAKSQDDVATMMVRLRSLHRVEDVTLADSEKGASGGTSQTGSSSSTPDSAGGGESCDLYKFNVSVSFKPAPTTSAPDRGAKKVPGRLGGGA